ncbi:MAG TPA: hypothetical protein VF885_14860 [Arthrobacter sp.]
MVHNKDIDAGLVRSRVEDAVRGLERELFADPAGADSDRPPLSATSLLQTISEMIAHLEEMRGPVVEEARDAGVTWSRIAAAAGLAQPSSAYFKWGSGEAESASESHEDRKARQRERIAEMRKRERLNAPKTELPGVSAMQAAEHYGIDRRTVKSRGERGEIRTVTVTNDAGKEIVRYLLD